MRRPTPPRETLKPWFDRASTAPEVLVAFPPKHDMIPALPDEPGFAGALNLVNHGTGEAILILLSGRPPSKRKDR